MENQNYYDILGVSTKATQDEITAAKNMLAKQYHPDANIKNGIDTTDKMQEILEAYGVLSDAARRAEYDREINGRRQDMQTFDLKADDSGQEQTQEDTFVTYWKAAGALYEIITESNELFRQKEETSRLAQLSMQALKHIIILKDAAIPEKYWHPDIMNWLLFTWYKNRNITIAYLLTMYDEYVKKSVTPVEKLKLQGRSHRFQHSVRKLIKY
ncbi:DnaJ domain-containing protein [Extibacter muris]|uniref:DnaJ domain-containing protein n=1 Tax=Extibacter muris TaxID=1796622 RepID=UPI001D080DBC|nr:DnaJ domain-containing protein [Extibacter muris]MCB6203383.1 DnaJ domain-containing protein [Extibacter muris]MCQ4664959.1 DnaJ domain-containing protein [Extibacter muris]MCQ4694324.1 DnaJ domain-containing protein [Extibacter muris]